MGLCALLIGSATAPVEVIILAEHSKERTIRPDYAIRHFQK
jgi:hypothetical protein